MKGKSFRSSRPVGCLLLPLFFCSCASGPEIKKPHDVAAAERLWAESCPVEPLGGLCVKSTKLSERAMCVKEEIALRPGVRDKRGELAIEAFRERARSGATSAERSSAIFRLADGLFEEFLRVQPRLKPRRAGDEGGGSPGGKKEKGAGGDEVIGAMGAERGSKIYGPAELLKYGNGGGAGTDLSLPPPRVLGMQPGFVETMAARYRNQPYSMSAEAARSFVEEKFARFKDAFDAYGDVVKEGDDGLAVAALARLGQLSEQFALELEQLPIGGLGDADVGAIARMIPAYCSGILERSKPLRAKARRFYRECLSRARKAGIDDSWARFCAARLQGSPSPYWWKDLQER